MPERRNIDLAVAVVRDGRPQYSIAAAAGIHATRLSAIVRGRATPTANERQRIAVAMGVSEDLLFGDAMTPA